MVSLFRLPDKVDLRGVAPDLYREISVTALQRFGIAGMRAVETPVTRPECRGGQLWSIATALCRAVNLLISWPTGAGKSLLYQVCAALEDEKVSTTVVIIPLRALAKDQVGSGGRRRAPR